VPHFPYNRRHLIQARERAERTRKTTPTAPSYEGARNVATKWKATMAIDIYALALEGHSDVAISKALGITRPTFALWKQQHRTVRYALRHARKNNSKQALTFPDFCEQRLMRDHREIWDKVNIFAKKRNAVERMNALFALKGESTRKHLFLYALINSSFDIGKCCKKLCISRSLVNYWMQHDPIFLKSVETIHTLKKEYFESLLIKKAETGDTNAIIFLNKTQNKNPGFLHDGYGEETTVKVQGEVNIKKDVQIRIEELPLPLDTRRQILEAIKATKISEEIVEQPLLTDQSKSA